MGIFNSGIKNSRIFQAGKARASIAGTSAILIGVSVQVGRTLTPVPTLTDGIVWSAQPAQGSLTANSILTSKEGKDLLTVMTSGDACLPMGISVKFDGSCDAGDVHIDIMDGYCTSVAFAASGGQGYIGNDFTVQFTNCNVS